MPRKTSFLEFWRSKKERAACLQRAKSLRLLPSQLTQLQNDGAVREALKSCRTASLLPPVGTDFLRPFTAASLAQMNQCQKKESRNGEKDDQKVKNNGLPKPSKDLEDGKPLPYIFGEPSAEHFNTPLEELDPFYQSEKTFLVLSKGKSIYRINAHKSCYLFSPLNPLRTLAIKIMTNSSLIFATILVNFIFLVTGVFPSLLKKAGFAFSGIFMLEAMVKIVSQGLCVGKFTFLRHPWNWPDVAIIGAAFLSLFVDFPMLTTVSLILKTIPIIPGLKKMWYNFVHSLKRLSGVIVLTVFLLCIFATIGLQLYMGNLRQKCIWMPSFSHNVTDFTHNYGNESAAFNYHKHIFDHANIYFSPGSMDSLVCGNSSDAGRCPKGFTCIRGGKTPNNGYTNYDNFGWSLLSSFRLLTQEYWENLMQLVMRSAGKFTFINFIFFFSPGCFVLVSLIVAVTAAAICELEQLRVAEASRKEQEFNQIVKALKRREEEEAASKAAKSDGEDSQKNQENQQTSKEEVGPQTPGSPRRHTIAELLLKWNCCGCWRWLKQWLHAIVANPFFDLGIVICIVVNIVFMTMEHFPLTEEFERTLSGAHLVFTFIYTVEMVIKIVALDPYNYFKVNWNVFDCIIVAISLVELSVANIEGLSVLRIFRLLRVFRLARWWHGFHVFLQMTLKYSFLLLIVFLGFVIVGYQLFHKDYTPSLCQISMNCNSRWHMASFFHSFLVIFSIFSGSWCERLWDCMEVSDPALCLTFFLSAIIIGNLLILHLFLISLLNPHSSDIVAPEERKKNSVEIAFGWCKTWILENLCPSLGCKSAADCQGTNKKDYVALNMVTSEKLHSDETALKKLDEGSPKCDVKQDSEVQRDQEDNNGTEDAPETCCCQKCYGCCPILNTDTSQGTGKFCFTCRKASLAIVQNKYFKLFVNFIVLLSSVALMFEDIYLHHHEVLKMVLSTAELVFALLFLMEMLLKWIGFGIKKYLSNGWYWLEFLIVNVFLLSLLFDDGGLGTLRILRVVRILSFFQGPKLVVGRLFQLIPSMFNGVLVLLMVWLIFSIMGVNMFAGKFYYCFNDTAGHIFLNSIVENKTECFALIFNNYTEVMWKNWDFNYDNVMMGYLSLLILGFSKSWYGIMYAAVDSRSVDSQPVFENKPYIYIYFVFFIITNFFALNFFIKVILSALQRKFGDKPIFMTKHQQKYTKVLMKLFPKNPQRAVPRPQNKCQARVFDLMNSPYYEVVMVVLICLNNVVLMIESMDESHIMEDICHWLHFFFILIFLIECILKIIAFRQHYFKDGWNIIDFIILLIQIIALLLADLLWYFISPSVFQCLRLFRISRVLHFIPWTRRIRKLLLAFVKSVPALFNIAFVLFLTMVVFSLIAMFNFAYVKKESVILDHFNFETFWSSMICMFMTSTTTAWQDMLIPIMQVPPSCDPFAEHPGTDAIGNCSSPILGVAFFATYVFLTFLLLIQLYITVALEIVNSEDTQGLCDIDLQSFCKTWNRFDPDGTELIPYSKLSEFTDSLQDPLRIPQPNATRLTHMDLPLYPGDKVHCTDVLLSLAKQVLDDPEEVESLKERMEKQFKAKQVPDEPISSTLRRKQEEKAAKVIQRAFRKGRHTQDKEKSAAEVSVLPPLADASE